jgi:CheY-like chemotaxis protein
VLIPYLIGTPKDIAEISARTEKNSMHRNSLKNMNVLLVEDNDINRLYASSILKTWDCNLEMAENGYVALEKIKNNFFNIILMDIQMPVMDGFEATKAIRLGEPPKSQVPIIALTANASPKDIEKCLAAGMNDCISKPFTPEELFRILLRFSPLEEPKEERKPVKVDLSYLKTIMSGNTDFIRDIVATFLNSMPQSVEEIRQLTKSGEWEKVSRAIHKIKPSLTMMGLQELGLHVFEIEEGIRLEQDLKVIAQQILRLTDDMDEALESLKLIKV